MRKSTMKNIGKKAVAGALLLSLVLTSVPVTSYAKEEGDVPVPEVTEEEPKAIPQEYDAYDIDMLSTVYEDNNLRVNVENAKINDEKDQSDGTENAVLIKAPASDVESGDITIDKPVDFSKAKAGRIIFGGLCERKKPATVSFYLDAEATPFATVDVVKQKGKDNWTKNGNASAPITKNITGKHTLKMKFSFKGMSAEDKKDKTSVLLRYVAFSAFDMPTINFNLDESQGTIAEMNNDSEHKTECYGDMSIEIPEGYKSEYGGADSAGTYELEYIRGRGNSTWGPSKRPYKVKLDKAADLFGMGKNKHWVLLANYFDYTMLRNKYTYYLTQKMNMEFTPQCIFVNVVMNGQYLGSYYLCEQVRVGKGRIEIDDLEDTPDVSSGEELTGGYFLSMEYGDGYRSFQTERGMQLYIENPEISEKANNFAQKDYIADYCQKVEDALFGKDFKDADGHSYTEYMDIDSAIDFYLIQEFSLNGDGFAGGSNYLYKKRNGKLYWGPLWDFDYVAWGATEASGNDTSGFLHNGVTWIQRMLEDPVFLKKFKERWKEVKAIFEDTVKDGGELDLLAKQMEFSQKTNYKVASTTLIDEPVEGEGELTYGSEVDRFKQWISERLNWFDANINTINGGGKKITFKVGSKKVAVVPMRDNYVTDEMLPNEPTKKGYKFLGWFTKKGNKYKTEIHDISVEKSITVYAKWEKVYKMKGGNQIVFLQDNVYCPLYYYELTLNYASYPGNVPVTKIKWSVDNKKLASIKNGVLQPKLGKEGTVTVTAKYNKKKITCKVHLVEGEKLKYMTSFKLVKTKLKIKKKSYGIVRVTPTPKKCAYEDLQGLVHFYSMNNKIATVDPETGVVKAKKKGKVTIVAIYGNTLKKCKVTVK